MAATRRRERDDDSGAGWLTTYGDMVTLLMAFFVLLYAMSSTDVLKFEAFLSGLAEPFGNQAAGQSVLPGDEGLVDEGAASIEPVVRVTEQSGMPTSVIDRPADAGAAEFEETRAALGDVADAAAAESEEARRALDDVEAALNEALRAAGLQDLVEQRREERGLVVSIASDDVLFALGSIEISPLGDRVIATVAGTLGNYGNDVLVEGHTDDLPLRRGGYTNWNLSTDRAVAVLTEMIEQHRFPARRIGAVGYGEFRPLAGNDSRDGRARNRRVDVVVLHEEATS